MKKPKKVSQADIARHWGVQRSYVNRMVNEGCPLTTLQAADDWRNSTRERQVDRSKGGGEEGNPAGATGSNIPPEEPEEIEEPDHEELLGLDTTGLERELKNARAMARSAARRVRQAEKTKGLDSVIGQRQQTYNKAVENYERMEKSVRREREARQELMTVDQHKIALNRLWVPVITLMRKLPRTLAIKVNPGDDVHAEKVLAAGVEELITEMRRSLKEPPDARWHLTVFMAATLLEQGRDQLIALLEEAIRSIPPPEVAVP